VQVTGSLPTNERCSAAGQYCWEQVTGLSNNIKLFWLFFMAQSNNRLPLIHQPLALLQIDKELPLQADRKENNNNSNIKLVQLFVYGTKQSCMQRPAQNL
jgi:hypothetical protein